MTTRHAATARTVTLLAATMFVAGCQRTPSPEKMAKKPSAATQLSDLERDGDYYVVTGADIHNLCGDLLNKKIKFRGKVDKTQGSMFGLEKPLVRVLADDGEFYLWVAEAATVPDDFKEAIQKGGLQVSEPVELSCTLDELPSEAVLTAYSELSKRSGISKNVDSWSR